MNANYDKNLFLYLSSVGQDNHADFQVNMSDPLTLPPHSQVRLVNARVNATNNIVEIDANNDTFAMFIGCAWSRTAGSYAPFFVQMPRGKYDLKNKGDPNLNFSAMLQKALNDAMTNFPRARGGFEVTLSNADDRLTIKLQSMESYIIPLAAIPAAHSETWTKGRNQFQVFGNDAGGGAYNTGGMVAEVSDTAIPNGAAAADTDFGLRLVSANDPANNFHNYAWISKPIVCGEVGGTDASPVLICSYYADFADLTPSQTTAIPDDNYFLWWFGSEKNSSADPVNATRFRNTPSSINVIKRYDNTNAPLLSATTGGIDQSNNSKIDLSDMFVVGAGVKANGQIALNWSMNNWTNRNAQGNETNLPNGGARWASLNVGNGLRPDNGNKPLIDADSKIIIQIFECGKSNVAGGGDLVRYRLVIKKKAPAAANYTDVITQDGNNYIETTLRVVQTNDYDTTNPGRFVYRKEGTPCSLMTSFATSLHRDGTEGARQNWGHGGGHEVAYALDPINTAQGGYIASGGGRFTTEEERNPIAGNVTINHSMVIMSKNFDRDIPGQNFIKGEFNKIDSTAVNPVAFANTEYWNTDNWESVYRDTYGNVECEILGLSARGFDGQADVSASYGIGIVSGDDEGIVKQTGEFPQYYLSLPDLPQLQNYTASKTGFNSKNAFLAPIDLSSVNNASVGDETYTSERKTELYNDLGNSYPITLNTLRIRVCDIDGVPTEDLDAYTIACIEVRPDPVIKQAKMMAKYMRQGDNLTDRQIHPYGNQVQ